MATDGPPGAEAARCPSPELATLQQRLEAKRDICRQLQEQIEACQAERDATRNACMAGFAAAREQMVQMQSELAAARRLQAAAISESADGTADTDTATAAVEMDLDKAKKSALELRARALRHEVSRWQHKIEALSAQQEKREADLARLTNALTHAGDVLDSTRNLALHAKIDLEFTPAPVQETQATQSQPKAAVPLFGGGNGCQTVLAEKFVRERTEEKNHMLIGKTNRLKGVFSAQQVLIHRMEKQLLKEEGDLDHKSMRLALEQQRQQQLKGSLRKRSDDAVLSALGMPANYKVGGGSMVSVTSSGLSQSQSQGALLSPPGPACPLPPPPSRAADSRGSAGSVEPAIKQDLGVTLPPIEA